MMLSPVTDVPQNPGNYALLLSCNQNRPVQIGRLGTLQLQPGTYVYVGSAFGPGGLCSRLAHRQEHLWAQLLMRSRGARQPLPGFGASDCSCPTHLFFFVAGPSFVGFRRRLDLTYGDRPFLQYLPLRVQA